MVVAFLAIRFVVITFSRSIFAVVAFSVLEVASFCVTRFVVVAAFSATRFFRYFGGRPLLLPEGVREGGFPFLQPGGGLFAFLSFASFLVYTTYWFLLLNCILELSIPEPVDSSVFAIPSTVALTCPTNSSGVLSVPTSLCRTLAAISSMDLAASPSFELAILE
uniref:Uncharacterized protein n=1 Tax=Cacopsylla melanoneura TaxID=428564 RepID=A0A8D9AZI7_9HEMI